MKFEYKPASERGGIVVLEIYAHSNAQKTTGLSLNRNLMSFTRYVKRYTGGIGLDAVGEINMQGRNFLVYQLPYDVHSCEDAAAAKGVPLAQELKSLVLLTSKGLYVLHLPGDKRVNIRAVKKALSVKEVIVPIKAGSKSKIADTLRLDPDNKLEELEIKYGTVCPFFDNIWNLPQLISNDVFRMTNVSTNNGKLNQYIFFNPRKDFSEIHPNIERGDFSKERE